jgi:hypothetical protein
MSVSCAGYDWIAVLMVKSEMSGGERGCATAVSKRGNSEEIVYKVLIFKDICDYRNSFDGQHAAPARL